MIGQSLPEYVFIRISILGLRLIAPLSILYLCTTAYLGQWLWSRWLGYYAAIEAAFYLGIYLPRAWFLQRPATHPEPLSRAEREALFAKCFATVHDTDLATGWFHFSPSDSIRRENVLEWISWALFSSPRNALLQQDWEDELEGYVKGIERLLGRKLEDGLNETINCMKVTLDPVVSLHRPLLWYIIVGIVDSYTTFCMSFRGFRHYTIWRWYCYFPPRLLSLFSEPSPHPRISYWYRPHRSKTKRPILFLHGIGIGLLPYQPFFADLIKHDPDVGIIAIENLPISMRISPPPLTRGEMLEAIAAILRTHAFQSYVVCGHSYGTVVAAHMMRDPALSSHVASWILVDPIPFLLHQPSVAYNFVYRTPRTANEWQLWYFASRDPDVARALARHFFWAESVLWKEDLEGKNVGVSLAGKDQILDAGEVRRYLVGQSERAEQQANEGEARNEGESELWTSSDGKLEVLWYPHLDHASVFDKRAATRALVDMLVRFVEKDSDSPLDAADMSDNEPGDEAVLIELA